MRHEFLCYGAHLWRHKTFLVTPENFSNADSQNRNFDRLTVDSKFWQPSKFWHVKISNSSLKKLFVVIKSSPVITGALGLSSLDPLTTITLWIFSELILSWFSGILKFWHSKFWHFVKISAVSKFRALQQDASDRRPPIRFYSGVWWSYFVWVSFFGPPALYFGGFPVVSRNFDMSKFQNCQNFVKISENPWFFKIRPSFFYAMHIFFGFR